MKSEFLESELELYVQRLLVHESYATGNKYKMLKISPNDERLKGYDAEIIGLTSFYCQFKTSDYLTKGVLYEKRQDFCTKTGWPKSPFYTFSLRVPNDAEDKENPTVWQHNVLNSLWRSNPSGVAYVAPMFHTRTELDLHEPLGIGGCCFCSSHNGSSGISIQTAGVNGQGRCRLPFFDGLISIPPHVPVKDLKHSYCFTSPSDISFHSAPKQVENGKTLGEALRSFVLQSIENDGQRVSDARMTLTSVRELLGFGDADSEFLEPLLAYGLARVGVSNQDRRHPATVHFENEASWLQQRVAFSAALKAFFGISTLGLLKVEED